MPATTRSTLHTRTTAKLTQLAEQVVGSNDWTFHAAINAKAAPLRTVIKALDLAFVGWSVREIEEEIDRGLTVAETRAVVDEHSNAAAYRRALADNAKREAEMLHRERAEQDAWLAAMAA